jgi:small conductance mechanosensitive channel
MQLDQKHGAKMELPSMSKVLTAMLTLLLILWFSVVQPPISLAQKTQPEAPAAPTAEQLFEAKPLTDASGLPAELLNPAIGPDELAIRLVPLTKADLAKLAEAWLVIVKAKTEEAMQAQLSIAKSEGAVEDAARQQLTTLTVERKELFEKFGSVLSAWKTKGGDEAQIREYRAYSAAIIIEEARTADFKTLLDRTVEWLTSAEGGVAIGKRIIIAAIWLYGLFIVARIARAYTRRRVDRIPNVSMLLQAFLVTVVYWLVLSVGLMMVLAILGINITPLFALFGGLSFIIGFAMQDTLSNLANGLMIMVNRPFDEGDYVELGSAAGTVKSVSIIATTITTADNQVIVLPNKQVWGNVITNVTASETRRVDLVFGIGYDDDIQQAIAVLNEMVAAHLLILKTPEPAIMVGALADSSVNINCRPWVKTDDYWSVYWDLMHQVKERFDEAGISIPYPQQDVHLRVIRNPQPEHAQ